jgi:hypothetical protein
MRHRLSLPLALTAGNVVLLVAAWAGGQQPPAPAPAPAPGPFRNSVPAPPGPLPAGPNEPTPPANQTYVGMLKCASCHFDKYQDWRTQQDKHARAYEILPLASRQDPACLKCHTTGYGEPTGFRTAADRTLAGITCESCHGPGSAHVELAKPFATRVPVPPEGEKIARDSIYLMLPVNVCVSCHATRGHQKHPEYAKR